MSIVIGLTILIAVAMAATEGCIYLKHAMKRH